MGRVIRKLHVTKSLESQRRVPLEEGVGREEMWLSWSLAHPRPWWPMQQTRPFMLVPQPAHRISTSNLGVPDSDCVLKTHAALLHCDGRTGWMAVLLHHIILVPDPHMSS